MSRSIDLYSYDYNLLKNELMEYCHIKQDSEIEVLEEILGLFGSVVEGRYIILNNEFSEEDNCYYNVSTAIERVFGVDDVFSNVFCTHQDKADEQELISATALWQLPGWDEDEDQEALYEGIVRDMS